MKKRFLASIRMFSLKFLFQMDISFFYQFFFFLYLPLWKEKLNSVTIEEAGKISFFLVQTFSFVDENIIFKNKNIFTYFLLAFHLWVIVISTCLFGNNNEIIFEIFVIVFALFRNYFWPFQGLLISEIYFYLLCFVWCDCCCLEQRVHQNQCLNRLVIFVWSNVKFDCAVPIMDEKSKRCDRWLWLFSICLLRLGFC